MPPSRLALDPSDVVRLDHDGRLAALRLTSVADAGARAIEAVRTDASAYGLAPGSDRSPRVPRPVVYGPPAVAILDLPQLRESTPAHQPLAAVHAVPWPGRIEYQPPAMGVQAGGGVGAGGDILYQGKPGLQMQYLGLSPEGTGFLYRVSAFAYGGNADTAAVVQSTYKLTSAVKDLGQE